MPNLRLYPDQSFGRLWRLLVDLVMLCWLLLWVAAGYLVYRTVLALDAVSDGLRTTGHTFNDWIGAFRNAAPSGIPVISDFLSSAAAALQRYSGDTLISTASQVRDVVGHLALALALLIAVPPILMALIAYGPWRWRDARELGAAFRFVKVAHLTGQVEQARAVLAYRAIATLTFRELMSASADPVGDLGRRDYDRLAAAMLRRAGVEPRRLPGPPLPQLER